MTNSHQTNASTVAIQTVDLKEMIARGSYDYSDGDTFTAEGTELRSEGFVFGVEPQVFQIDRSLDPKMEMEKLGYRPATIYDLLEYGIKNPYEQRIYPIVALGTEIALSEDVTVIAYLDGSHQSRGLYADWGCGHDCEADDKDDVLRQDYLNRRRFLGVKK